MNNTIDRNYLVCVICKTYNQVAFINDALDGFVSQETKFPFVCVIVDDASTDGEPEVIKDYLNAHFSLNDQSIVRNEETDDYSLTFAQHRSNVNCFFAVIYLKYNHYSIKKSKDAYIAEWTENAKYHALCEGDDYWIDSTKLQKQVEFLETHSDYSMCFHRAQLLNTIDCECGLKCEDICNREYNPNELLEKWKVPTASTLFNPQALKLENIGSERVLNSDIMLVLNCAKIGKIRGMSDVMSVYRIHGGGVTYDEKFQKERLLKYPNHFKFIKDNYPFLNQGLVNSLIMCSYFNRRTIQISSWGYLKDTLLAEYYRIWAALYNKLFYKIKILS